MSEFTETETGEQGYGDMSEPGSRMVMAASDEVEIYKIFAETAERNIDRRNTKIRFYYSVSGGVLLAQSVVLSNKTLQSVFPADLAAAALALIGMVTGLIWILSVLAHRRLSEAKYHVLIQLEAELPFKPFALEWDFLKGKRRALPSQTWIDLMVPILLILLQLGALGYLGVGYF